MTGMPIHGDRLGQAGRLAVWAGAAAFVTTAYGLGLGWLMQRPVELDGADETLPAIMIDLAEEPAALNTDDDVAAVSETDAEEVKSEEAKPLPEPVAEEKTEPKPVEEIPEPVRVVEEEPEEPPPVEQATRALPPEMLPLPEEEDPVVENVTKMLDNVAIPLPLSRPELQEVSEKPPEKKKKPKKKKTASAPASKLTLKAKAKVRESDANAAKVASEGKSKSVSSAEWKSRVIAHLQRHKRYPAGARRQKAEGTVQVRFRIDDRGNVLSVSLSRSSGFAELDRAAVAMVRNLSPVPAPPPGVSRTIVAPVYFTLF